MKRDATPVKKVLSQERVKPVRYYPVFLNLKGRQVLVIGGGKVAERKVRKLLRAGARVRVVSPELTPGLERFASGKHIVVIRQRYKEGALAGDSRRRGAAPLFVFAATNDPGVQRKILKDARVAGAIVNVANSAPDCDFIVPASFTRGELHVAISSSGRDPALARYLRLQLEAALKRYTGQGRRAVSVSKSIAAAVNVFPS